MARLAGDEIAVAISPHYMLQGRRMIETKYERLSFTTAPTRTMITAQADADGGDQDDYRYLVMPVRLPN